ncbi:hypothetical protein ANANG_G00160750 [Anguilla anguilla]|uniref:Uncharacterized protein n=1 Tax=Anguilla anguilla TaxID=7936 RepID=A0A9D3M889_ANGAN|nr:hypothetical protein ANANG_G00160750 [Anguilla anguilla]
MFQKLRNAVLMKRTSGIISKFVLDTKCWNLILPVLNQYCKIHPHQRMRRESYNKIYEMNAKNHRASAPTGNDNEKQN